jgi:hypothetical protein
MQQPLIGSRLLQSMHYGSREQRMLMARQYSALGRNVHLRADIVSSSLQLLPVPPQQQ